MKFSFPKDIVLFDFEAKYKPEDAGDPEKSYPTQVGAVLLDKATLVEENHFVSYVRGEDAVSGAPSLSEVGKKCIEIFGKDFMFCSWVSELDRTLFRKMIRSAGFHPRDFDYHVYDLWPIAYTYLLERGYTGSMRSEEMFQAFGLPARGIHDALEDCRHAATVLRKIVAEK